MSDLIRFKRLRDYICLECYTKQEDNVRCVKCDAKAVKPMIKLVELFGVDWEERLHNLE